MKKADKHVLEWMEREKSRLRNMDDHDRSIAMSEKLINMEAWMATTGDMCGQHGDSIVTMMTYWKVAIGVMVLVIAPAIVGIVLWILSKGGTL